MTMEAPGLVSILPSPKSLLTVYINDACTSLLKLFFS